MNGYRQLRKLYRELLLDGIVPFWLRHGADREHGGVLSCMTEEGQVLSEDKYVWSQARWLWTLSALYNRIEPRPEFLELARDTARFLLEHCRDAAGDWVYHTGRKGSVIEGPVSIYSDCFAVYGLSEFYRAAPDERVLQAALETHRRIRRRIAQPGFRETAPYLLPAGRKAHAVPMILTEVTNELAGTAGSAELRDRAAGYAAEVMDHFLRPDGFLVEYLSDEYEPLPGNEGSAVVPGHAIESMWFVMHVARRVGNSGWVERAAAAVRHHLETGWDGTYGGIYLGIDARSLPPFIPNAEKKLWWPHTEALYALLLTERLTGAPWCREWYERVHDWAFRHFAMPETGEWRQRLTRDGRPTQDVVALPVKDPFHLPRAAILITQLLRDAAC